jgi:O-antigen/teichoic acid export membrane protein
MADVHKKAAKGIRLLLVRQLFLQLFTFAGGVVLARILSPADFGVFAITHFIVLQMALLADFGMSPALIQRKEELTDHDMQVSFTVRHFLVLAVVVLAWVLAPWIAGLYGEGAASFVWLIRVLAVHLYLDAWKNASALQLERHLRFEKLAVIEMVEGVAYQGTAVVMAWMGFGVWSLVGAVMVKSVLGVVLVYLVAPWPVRFRIDGPLAKEMLRFGLPFQVNRVLGNMRNWVTPTLVATLVGPAAVGFLTWASANGRKPLQMAQNVIRVSLPHFSRIQDNLDEVQDILSRYVVYFALLGGFWVAILFTNGQDLVAWIYTAKWLPAMPALVLYAVLLNINAVSWSVKTALSATGQVRKVMNNTLYTTVVSMVLSFSLVYGLNQMGGSVARFAFIGVPIAEIISLALTTPQQVRLLGKGANRKVFGAAFWVLVPVLASSVAGKLLLMLSMPVPVRAVLGTLCTTLVYAAVAWLLAPAWLKDGLTEVVRRKLGRAKGPQKVKLQTQAVIRVSEEADVLSD